MSSLVWFGKLFEWRRRVAGGRVWFGVVELGFGGVGDFGVVGAVVEVGDFGDGRVGEHEGVGVCMDGRWDMDVAGKWWER